MKSRLLSAAAAIALVSGVAQAADLPVYDPPPPAMMSPMPIAYNWSGFYIGLHGGFGWADVDGDEDEDIVLGGQIGTNWQWGGFVLGAEGDASWAGMDGVDWLASGRLRGGFAIDRLLVYGTGGVAGSDADFGWVFGGGAEFALTESVSLGAEYLHYDFGSDDADVIRGRVNWKFNSLLGG